MKTRTYIAILLLTLLGTFFNQAAAQPPHMSASGTFDQTFITSLDAWPAGPNMILEQTSGGVVSGTLYGSYTDILRVVIHPNGKFNARFTIQCECTVDGKSGILHLVANDQGVMVGPDLATFSGRAVITGGSGELADLRGVLQIEGFIDLTTGLSNYDYLGRVH